MNDLPRSPTYWQVELNAEFPWPVLPVEENGWMSTAEIAEDIDWCRENGIEVRRASLFGFTYYFKTAEAATLFKLFRGA